MKRTEQVKHISLLVRCCSTFSKILVDVNTRLGNRSTLLRRNTNDLRLLVNSEHDKDLLLDVLLFQHDSPLMNDQSQLFARLRRRAVNPSSGMSRQVTGEEATNSFPWTCRGAEKALVTLFFRQVTFFVYRQACFEETSPLATPPL